MKNLIYIFLAFMFVFMTSAYNPKSDSITNNTEAGISFHQGSWDEALQLAKQQDKLIFLDISASWCGHCKKLKSKTFPNKKVGEYYNSNFINVAVDGEKGEGVKLAQLYKVKEYPSLIYIDANGKLIAQTAGYKNSEQLIDLGKKIIDR